MTSWLRCKLENWYVFLDTENTYTVAFPNEISKGQYSATVHTFHIAEQVLRIFCYLLKVRQSYRASRFQTPFLRTSSLFQDYRNFSRIYQIMILTY